MENQAILLVEDNEDDVFFLQNALKAASISNPVRVACDGQRAIDYLSGTGQYTDRKAFPLPALVLLDLKLPVKGGFEVLSWLRQQIPLRSLIVLILTSSSEPSDLTEAYRLGANSYLVKPSTSARLSELANAIKKYWLEFNSFDESTLNGTKPATVQTKRCRLIPMPLF